MRGRCFAVFLGDVVEKSVLSYAVFGNPVAHSRSPLIHALFAGQEGVPDLRYEAVCLPKGAFADGAAAFFAGGGLGANVTVPFKEDAYAWADVLSEQAAAAGAVNTLARRADGTVFGDNTDGIGLLADLRFFQVALKGARVLLLGAGGAARGVLRPLLDAQPAELTLANRTPEKARVLADVFGVSAAGLAELPSGGFDIVINATSGGLQGCAPELPSGVFSDCVFAYDMVYGAEETAFMRLAKACGVPAAADGLGMLVEQAAASYRIWRGFSPDTAAVRLVLRRHLAGA